MIQTIKNRTVLSYSILILSFLFLTAVNAQIETAQKRVYIKIEIKGMACPYCAFGMEKELKKVVGVNNVVIEFKKGLAYISTLIGQKPTKENLEKIITDAGFTVGKIEFSSKAFPIKNIKNN